MSKETHCALAGLECDIKVNEFILDPLKAVINMPWWMYAGQCPEPSVDDMCQEDADNTCADIQMDGSAHIESFVSR